MNGRSMKMELDGNINNKDNSLISLVKVFPKNKYGKIKKIGKVTPKPVDTLEVLWGLVFF